MDPVNDGERCMNYLRYGIVFVVTALGVGVLLKFASAAFAASSLGSTMQVIVPGLIGAVVEGQQYAKANKARPSNAAAWKFAWIGAGVATLLNIALAYGAGGFLPEFGKLAIVSPASKQFLLLIVIYSSAYLIGNRLFVVLGAGNQLSLMASREERK